MRTLLPNRIKYIFSSESHKPVGKWSFMMYEDIKIKNNHIDISNEDHCTIRDTSSIEEHIRDIAIKNNEIRIKELRKELKKELRKELNKNNKKMA
jgi:hypothetical protein